jgi:hypothetical protein
MKGSTKCDEIFIDELEVLMREDPMQTQKCGAGGKLWSRREMAILTKYYGYVKTRDLIPYMENRNLNQIHAKALRMGLSTNKDEDPVERN